MAKTDPKPPTTPRVRTLHEVAKTQEVVPFFLEGDHEIIQEARMQNRLGDLYGDDEFFAVGVGHLKFRHYMDYERIYGEPLDNAVNRILWLCWAVNKVANPKIDEHEVPKLEVVDGGMMTPMGKMVGSLSLNLAELLGWLLSRLGQIVGLNPDGTFVYAAVEPSTVIDMFDPSSLMKVDDDGTPLFFEILDLTGLNPLGRTDQVKTTPTDAEAPKDDDLGNSPSKSNDVSSTNAPKKRAR